MLPVAAFCALGLILLLHHEMWQDEWQAWLIARDSPSLAALFRNLRYEGHPGLWHLGLFLVSRLTPSPSGMQVLHLLVATGAVYLFLTYAPFTRLEKLLFIFGYFPLYEYCAISRNYGLGILGLFAFCALYCAPPPRRYLLLALTLLLMCQTNVYAVMIAMALTTVLLMTAVRDSAAGTWKRLAVLIIALLGLGLAVIQLVPPADSNVAAGWRLDLTLPHLTDTLAAVWKSYVPIPAPTYHFWGTNVIPDPRWQALFSVFLLVFGLLLFIRQPVPLCLYVLGTAGILAFTYTKYPGSIRHHGHLFILFIASLWLSSVSPPQRMPSDLVQRLSDFCTANRHRVVLAILAAHLLAGAAAASLDLWFPFSASREAALYIQQHRWDRGLILADADDAASSVAGCLGRRLYYPASRGWGSFIVWNRERQAEVKPEELLRQSAELSRRYHQDALLLLNYELPPGKFPVTLLQKFTRSLVPQENYYLYLAPRASPEKH